MLHLREKAGAKTMNPGGGVGTADEQQRSVAIDFIRAFSILWIVGLWHVIDYLPEVGQARNAVTYRITVALLGLFVLVSGYLMGRKDVAFEARSLRGFYVGRFGRIYPPFIVACLLFAICKLSTPLPLIKAALLGAMLWGPPPNTLWFIAMIALFYAATPLFIIARRNPPIYLGLAVALTLAAVAGAHFTDGRINPRLAMYLPSYCAGIWLAGHAVRWSKLLLIGLATALPALVLSLLSDTAMVEKSMWSMPWALAGSVALFGAAMHFDRNLPRWGWVLVVAQASYFLYLLHRPI
ncbi:MAG: acyltransferase [Sphingomonadaceae bacterium]